MSHESYNSSALRCVSLALSNENPTRSVIGVELHKMRAKRAHPKSFKPGSVGDLLSMGRLASILLFGEANKHPTLEGGSKPVGKGRNLA